MNAHMLGSCRLAENVRPLQVMESGFCLTACFGSACLIQLELNTQTDAINECGHAVAPPVFP